MSLIREHDPTYYAGIALVERADCSFRMLIKAQDQAGSMFYYDPAN